MSIDRFGAEYQRRASQAKPAQRRAADLRDWTPRQHVDRACDLLAIVDIWWDDDGVWVDGGGSMSTPPNLTAAQIHLEIANQKRLADLLRGEPA